jgi:protein-S-isoprenylcysteine O-methyltransferase Ste14
MRNITPIIMSLTLMTLICIVSFMRLGNKNIWGEFIFNFDVLFVCIYLLWMILESKVSKNEIKKGNKTHDFGTCEIYAVGQALTILSALWFNSIWDKPNFLHLIGFSLFLTGLFYRLWAVKTLGKYYSHIVREVDEQIIIKNGPYQQIRHPAYAGMIIANIGIVIYFFNLLTFSVFFLILFPAIILRIYIEEKTLFKIDGYAEFAKTRKRILPLIW